MFTENFERYLSFDYGEEQFIIKDVDDNEQVGAIPRKLFDCVSQGMKKSQAQVGIKAKSI